MQLGTGKPCLKAALKMQGIKGGTVVLGSTGGRAKLLNFCGSLCFLGAFDNHLKLLLFVNIVASEDLIHFGNPVRKSSFWPRNFGVSRMTISSSIKAISFPKFPREIKMDECLRVICGLCV